MKKILTLLIGMVCVLGMNPTYAIIDLVYLKERPSDIVSINVVKIVLENMGYDVNLFPVDGAKTMWQAIANGEADGMVSAWLPTLQSLYAYTYEFDVDNLGPNLEGTRVGLLVPTYVTIDSIGKLNAYADQFVGGKITGNQDQETIFLTQKAVSAYRLELGTVFGVKQVTTDILKAAINNQQWVVVTGWTPNLQFSRWDLKYLNDPQNIYGGEEHISTIVRLGLQQDMPEVYQVLDNFYWTLADIEQVMQWNQEAGADPYQNAKRWVQENPDKVMTWTGKIPIIRAATYNMDTGRLHLPVVEIYSEGQQIGTITANMRSRVNTEPPLFELEQEKQLSLTPNPIGYGSVLQRILKRNKLICGIRESLEQKGFAYLDEKGRYEGFDVALCRAVAVAVLNNAEAVEFVPLRASERGELMRSGKLDMLSRMTTWTTTRDANWGDFIWTMFYDGQGFMVKKESGITTFEQLDGATICVARGTTTELNLKDSFVQRRLTFMPFLMNEEQDFTAYEAGQCTAITSDKSQLAEGRSSFTNPNAHLILDLTVSKEPLTPVVPHGDSQWVDIVRTVMLGLINAEEFGITRNNVDFMTNSLNLHIRRLLGVENSFGQSALGLKQDAIANVIRALGNYGEIYERYMGVNGIGIPRGLNRLWTEGGLLYAPPLR